MSELKGRNEENPNTGGNGFVDQEWPPFKGSMGEEMSDEDRERYEKRLSGEAAEEDGEFGGEKNETFATDYGEILQDENGDPIMRKRSATGNPFDYTPRQEGESKSQYGQRLRWQKLMAEKAMESPLEEGDYRYKENGERDAAATEAAWRERVGAPTLAEYMGNDGVDEGTSAEDISAEAPSEEDNEEVKQAEQDLASVLEQVARKKAGQELVDILSQAAQQKAEEEAAKNETPNEPFDTANVENPTQDDLSYEAWLKSNAMVEEETDSSDIDGENPDKPFDTRDIEKPTQDDLSYEAWLRSNANPDQLDADGNPTGAVTPDRPFDTRDIENPTQDDLSYEAWLKSNANPDAISEDGQPNLGSEVRPNGEDKDGKEYDPTKSRWSQMSDEEKDALIHKYPRQEGENTNDWGKRIEASEGHRIFGVETEAVKDNAAAETATENTEESKEEAAKDNVEQTAKNGTADTAEQTTGGDAAETTKQTAEGTADKTTSKEAASDSAASDEGTAPAETSNETTSESSEGNATEGEAAAQAEGSTQETADESSSTKEAPAVETEAGQEDAEKVKEGLLAQLSGGKMAEWVESVKKLTRGQMKEMNIDALQGLIDEYNGSNGGPDGGLENVSEGEDLGDGDKSEGSMAGQAAEMPPAAGILDGSDHASGDEARSVDANEAGAVIEAAENGVESFENETEKLNSRMDSILKYQDQSGVWEAMRTLLDKCSEGVKATVEHARQERLVARSKDMIAQYRRELKSLPLFTLPWSEARQRKNDLRAVIKTSLESLEYNEDSLRKLESSLPESLSDEEKGQVDAFSRMDIRMDRINADLHVRGNLIDIRMRENWISDQERSIANNAGGINAPSVEKRRAFIAKTRADISNFQAAIDNYQEAHPDFVLYPADGFKNPSYEDIMNSYDNSPDVVTDEEDEDIEDLDGEA